MGTDGIYEIEFYEGQFAERKTALVIAVNVGHALQRLKDLLDGLEGAQPSRSVTSIKLFEGIFIK